LSTSADLEAINGGTLQVAGSFGAADAKQLAGQLATALPVALQVESIQTLH
jgi:preprotein translocase subunit SecD